MATTQALNTALRMALDYAGSKCGAPMITAASCQIRLVLLRCEALAAGA